MLSVDNTLVCMFQRLYTLPQDGGVLIFGGGGGGGGYVLSGHCSRQQNSVKTEGYLISEGYLFTGFYGIHKFQKFTNNMKINRLRIFQDYSSNLAQHGNSHPTPSTIHTIEKMRDNNRSRFGSRAAVKVGPPNKSRN